MGLDNDSVFKEFVYNILRTGGVGENWFPRFTTQPFLELFQRALTHESHDPNNNYEVFEYYGDSIMNLCIVQWIYDTHPDITNISWLAKIKAYLQSAEIVGQIGVGIGLDKFVKFDDPAFAKGFKTSGGRESVNYDKMMKYCLNAMFGCIGHIVRDLNLDFAVAIAICKNIAYAQLDRIDPQITDYNFVYDNASKLADAFSAFKWPFGWDERKNPNNTVTMTLKYWPSYDIRNTQSDLQYEMSKFLESIRAPISGKITPWFMNSFTTYFGDVPRKKFYAFFGNGRDLVNFTESLTDLDGLKQYLAGVGYQRIVNEFPEYQPRQQRLRNFSKQNEMIPRSFPSTQFIEFIRNILKNGGVSDEWTEKFLTRDNAKLFQRAVTHESYDRLNNYEVFEYYGDSIINLCIVQWVYDTHPEITNISWLEKIKGLFQSTKIIRQIGENIGLDKYVMYDTPDARYRVGGKIHNEIVEDTVESLFGCIGHIVRELGLEFAIAIAICKKITYAQLDKINPPITDYNFVYDNISKLKELLDIFKWPFGWIEQRGIGTTTLSLRYWPTYDVEHAHPRIRNEMINFLRKNKRAMKGSMDASLVNSLNAHFRGITSRLLYNDYFRMNQTDARDQFTTYFGVGKELVSMTVPSNEIDTIKQTLAGKAYDKIVREFPEQKPQPPPLQGKTKTQQKIMDKYTTK